MNVIFFGYTDQGLSWHGMDARFFLVPQFGIAKLANIVSKVMQILEFRIDHISISHRIHVWHIW